MKLAMMLMLLTSPLMAQWETPEATGNSGARSETIPATPPAPPPNPAPPPAPVPIPSKGPYFRFIGHDNYQLSEGALFSSKDIAKTQESTVIGLITHSTKDGSILPLWLQQYIAPEDWALGTAVNYGGGNGSMALGFVFNVTPQLEQTGLSVLNYLAPNSMTNVKSFLQNVVANHPDISVAIGPMLNLEMIQNGTWMPFNRWALDPLRYFCGASWKF